MHVITVTMLESKLPLNCQLQHILVICNLLLVTDISELEQRILDLPLRDKGEDNVDIISVKSDGSSEPSDYRPWENHADRALLPSCKNICVIINIFI